MKVTFNTNIILSSSTMLFTLAARRTAGFAFNRAGIAATASTRAYSGSPMLLAKEGQAEVILVGCGAPNRGMGWYHAVQMLEDK
jgi:hypothetical protein